MTLIVAVTGKQSIWLLADRRLSAGGKSVEENAVKLMVLQRGDDIGILGYSGLGATQKTPNRQNG